MKNEKLVAVLIVVLALVGCALLAQGKESAGQWKTVPDLANARYVELPPSKVSTEKIGFCLALHGMAGDALSYGTVWHKALGGEYLVVAPQAPPKKRVNSYISTWQTGTDRNFLFKIWEDVHKRYNIDPARTTVIGYSAGVYPACDIARTRKDQLAGLVLQGGGLKGNPEDFMGLHIYLLTATRDGGLGPAKGQSLFSTLFKLGIDVQLEVVEGADHASVYAKVNNAAKWIMSGYKLN